jgi:co-chaperonin GroES (HSP10)
LVGGLFAGSVSDGGRSGVMSDPKDIGNRATEIGEFEQGADFSGVNSSGLPVSGPILDVEIAQDAGNIQLFQKTYESNRRRTLELTESKNDLLGAQLLEDPEMTSFTVPNVGVVEASPSRMQKAIARNANREQLVWFGIDSQNMSAALGDRIIVRRDALESEYVCRACKGKGHTEEVCKHCGGKQNDSNPMGAQPCKSCRVLGYGGETPHPSGFQVCVECRGSGWKNGIIIPEVAQGKPVTGVVVSLGPACSLLKLGDRVLHSKYAGHTLEMKAETYTFMREFEVISLLRDLA